jgi:glycosyltransferase involved in cell wall biosynthesis
LEMEHTLVLSGPVHPDEVPAYIDAMDICVLPDSNAFGSPIALFEFMAMGKPSVVPDLGPMRDVIDNNVTGIVFPHADYGALKSALLGLVEDPELRIQIGARARDMVFKRHTWPSNARFLVQLVTGEVSGSRFPTVIPIDGKTQQVRGRG